MLQSTESSLSVPNKSSLERYISGKVFANTNRNKEKKNETRNQGKSLSNSVVNVLLS